MIIPKHRQLQDLVKVVVELEQDAWHGYGSESLWAEPLGQDRYRIQSVPFYARGISYDDIVIAKPIQRQLVVQNISQRGGHSTYRFFLSEDITDIQDNRFVKYRSPLEAMGCTYERATERLFAMDVPPHADIYKIYDALKEGESAEVWEFEEAHCGHLLSQ